MTSISSSYFTCSSPLFSASGFANNGPHSPPSSITYRPLRVSASCTSTVDRPRTRTGSSSSLYEVLGIHTDATSQEIKSAFRKLARVVHPDVATDGQTSADEFMKVHEAYSTLSDAQKRADYDRMMLIRRPRSSYSYATTMSGSAAGRRWETDQCW
ncbi:chaperone protein dnaJ 11, chloroplastic-like [Prunus avium]|uniref:Chaperone protein dnaJ 11, chloroplastic-like n=1 Tax=Prunus avium TaxID=42229 RepID=A0A6P5TWQ4_PRUAV|nr:chaperone protein dnaJ 11, chloroplastic-like [Prunus avium]